MPHKEWLDLRCKKESYVSLLTWKWYLKYTELIKYKSSNREEIEFTWKRFQSVGIVLLIFGGWNFQNIPFNWQIELT